MQNVIGKKNQLCFSIKYHIYTTNATTNNIVKFLDNFYIIV